MRDMNFIFNPELYYENERSLHKQLLGYRSISQDYRRWRREEWIYDEDHSIAWEKDLPLGFMIMLIYDCNTHLYELYLMDPDGEGQYSSPLFRDDHDPLLWAIYDYIINRFKEL